MNKLEEFEKKLGSLALEEAEAYHDWLTNPRTQARRRVEMCGGFDSSGAWYLRASGLSFGVAYMINKYGGLSFATEKQAKACIDLLGEDVIKLALGIGEVK